MRIALINPLMDGANINQILPYFDEIPLGIGYIASFLGKRGIEADIIDCMNEPMNLESLLDRLTSSQYDIIGISCFTYNFKSTVFLVRKIKETFPKTFLFLGGYMPTISGESLYQAVAKVDCMICGEGEHSVCELVEAIQENRDWTGIPGLLYRRDNQLFRTDKRSFIEDLDSLPFPKRGSIFYKNTASIITSRGCYGSCHFCCAPRFFESCPGNKSRFRSPENVLAEIVELYDNQGIRFFRINDDNFMMGSTGKKEWIDKFCSDIKDGRRRFRFRIMIRANEFVDHQYKIKQLVEIGLQYVFIGIESMVQRQLDYYNKQIKVETNIKALKMAYKMGLKVRLGFILIDPYVTIEEIIENIRLLRSCRIAEMVIGHQELLSCTGPLLPLNGSKFYDDIKNSMIGTKEGMLPYRLEDSRCHLFYEVMHRWSKLVGPINNQLSRLFDDNQNNEILEQIKATLYGMDLCFLEQLSSNIQNGSLNNESLIQQSYERICERMYNIVPIVSVKS